MLSTRIALSQLEYVLFCEEAVWVRHRLDLERVAGGVAEEHRRLLAGLAPEAHCRRDREIESAGPEPGSQPFPVRHREHRSEMRHRHLVAVDRVAGSGGSGARHEMGDD